MVARRSQQIALLVVAAAAASSSTAFVPHQTLLLVSSSADCYSNRKSVVMSDVSDEWWMDEPSKKDKKELSSSSSSSPPEEEKLDLSSSEQEVAQDGQFLQGEELKQLRTDLESYRENLKYAQVLNDQALVDSLSNEIALQEAKDPEVVYNKAKKLIEEAQSASRAVLKPDLKEKLIEHWSAQRELARECLPRFQMEGLWVGNYGNGPQLINVTYAGDTLVATKVTGDSTVPRGQVSFTANLSPPPLNATAEAEENDTEDSDPNHAAEKKYLPSRYGESIFPGQGQLAKKNFKDPKFIPGVFIVYDNKGFSFSWVPTSHNVFFVRPSSHDTLRLLRDVLSKEDEVENMRDHLNKCFQLDATTWEQQHEQQQEEDPETPFRRIKRQSDLDFLRKTMEMAEEAKKENKTGSIFNFWRATKWRKYIDGVLGSEGGLMG